MYWYLKFNNVGVHLLEFAVVIEFVATKNHRNGIKKPKQHRYPSLKGVRHYCDVVSTIDLFGFLG